MIREHMVRWLTYMCGHHGGVRAPARPDERCLLACAQRITPHRQAKFPQQRLELSLSQHIEGPDVMVWQLGRGALRFGGLTGLFYGVQMTSSIARNRRDMQDTILAALVAGAVMGISGESAGDILGLVHMVIPRGFVTCRAP